MKKALSFNVDTGSVKTLQDNLKIVQGLVLNSALEAVDELAEIIRSRSIAGTPVRSGALWSSVYMESEMTPDGVTAHIGYGGKYNKLNPETLKWSDSYAVEVHESRARSDQSRKFGATWKFLERALISVKPVFLPFIGNHIAEALSGAGEMRIQRQISNSLKNSKGG